MNRGNTPPTPPPKAHVVSGRFARIEDVPPDWRGPFSVGHIPDRSELSAAELARNAEADAGDAAIDLDETREVCGEPDDAFAWGAEW